LGGRGRWISEFKASLVYKSEFQDSQGYTEKPCLKQQQQQQHKKENKQKQKNKKATVSLILLRSSFY
jgi:Sec-independent protein translocase protein TatA